MSTPQDTPNSGRDNGNGRSWDAPGAPGDGASRNGPARSGQPGRYNYPAGAASGYSYPGGGSMPQGSEKGPAPKEVMRAYQLILAAGILYFLSNVVTALFTDLSVVTGMDNAAATMVKGITLVVAAIGTTVYVLLAVFIRKGHNWARITATVLAGINVVSTLIGLLVTPLVNAQAAELGQSAADTPLVTQLIGSVVMLLGVAGVIMTYLKPARPYFTPKQVGY